MDYLQYYLYQKKPVLVLQLVLNLIINGLPSIRYSKSISKKWIYWSFKPYYKWITFNTILSSYTMENLFLKVLNLIINGLPSILIKKAINNTLLSR